MEVGSCAGNDQGVLVWPDSGDLALHQQCPLTDLLKCVPQFVDIVELYYRCKLCPVLQVHQGKSSLLRHIENCHATHYRPPPPSPPSPPVPRKVVTMETYPPAVLPDPPCLTSQLQVKAGDPCQYGQYVEVDFGAAISQPVQTYDGPGVGDALTISPDVLQSDIHVQDVHIVCEATTASGPVIEGTTGRTADSHIELYVDNHMDSPACDVTRQSTSTQRSDAASGSDVASEAEGDVKPSARVAKRRRSSPAPESADWEVKKPNMAVADAKQASSPCMREATNDRTDTGQGHVSGSDWAPEVDEEKPWPGAGVSSEIERVGEALVKCTAADCTSYVKDKHFHCKPCGAVVKEGDVTVHRYSHACVRPFCDFNFLKIVEQGAFCDRLACLKQADDTGPKSSLHVHCRLCPAAMLEAGLPFHTHLKQKHRKAYDECLSFDGVRTSILQCLYCRAFFDDEAALVGHTSRFHFQRACDRSRGGKDAGKYVMLCPHCPRGPVFRQVDALKVHVVTKHKLWQPHVFRQHVLRMRCLLCDDVIVGKATLSRHMWREHGEAGAHVCESCSGVFGSPAALEEH